MTPEEIDAMVPGRKLDALIEEKIMGRKIKLEKGPACAWDGDGKPIMYGKDDYIIEDYNPIVDGVPIPAAKFNPKLVFDYSYYDLGMVRVLDRMVAGSTLHEIMLAWNSSSPGWVTSVRWFDPILKQTRTVHGQDLKYARLAVYRGCLKAVLT